MEHVYRGFRRREQKVLQSDMSDFTIIYLSLSTTHSPPVIAFLRPWIFIGSFVGSYLGAI